MKNFVQAGSAITLDAPKAVQSGAGLMVGALFGVASGSALQGQPVTIATTGVYDLLKAGDALPVGAALYWNDAAGLVTTDDGAGSNPAIGHAVAGAAAGAATARVRLSI